MLLAHRSKGLIVTVELRSWALEKSGHEFGDVTRPAVVSITHYIQFARYALRKLSFSATYNLDWNKVGRIVVQCSVP